MFKLKTIFMLVEQEIFTLPEQLSSPTDFDHLRKRSYWLIVEDDHISFSIRMTDGIVCFFVFVFVFLYWIEGTIFYASGQELLTHTGAPEFTHGFRSSTDFIG